MRCCCSAVTATALAVAATFLVPGLADEGTAKTLTITFVCATPEAFTSTKLESALDDIPGPTAGVAVWRDRAVALNLDVDSADEFLVPLDCGATCNCSWAAIDDDRHSVGIIEGCVLFIDATADGWAEIRTFLKESVSEGEGLRYTFDNGSYHMLGSDELAPDAVLEWGACMDDSDCCPSVVPEQVVEDSFEPRPTGRRWTGDPQKARRRDRELLDRFERLSIGMSKADVHRAMARDPTYIQGTRWSYELSEYSAPSEPFPVRTVIHLEFVDGRLKKKEKSISACIIQRPRPQDP